jgi:SAM-dependent methyltransferase
VTCRICFNRVENSTYQAREMMFGFRERFTYFQCSRCGCLQIATVPPDMSKYYPETYYAYAGGPATPPLPAWTPRRLAKRLRNRFAVLRRGAIGRVLHRLWPNEALAACISTHFPGDGARDSGLTAGSRVLDVGSGAGDLLVALQSAGFRHLLGIDIYPVGDLSMPRAPLIQNRDIREVSGQWDLVMFHHSFEHMADPRGTLEAVVRLLAPDGVCLIRLPLASSHAWAHYGVDWVQLDAPRHFFLHTEESLRRLADDAGLEISKISYDSSAFQFFGSELYRRDIPLQSTSPADVQARASAFTADDLVVFEKRARDLNAQRRGDQAAFYLRKRHRPA